MIYRLQAAYNRLTFKMEIDERVETFFSLRMGHHAGRSTAGPCTETMGINSYSKQEKDNYTQTLDK